MIFKSCHVGAEKVDLNAADCSRAKQWRNLNFTINNRLPEQPTQRRLNKRPDLHTTKLTRKYVGFIPLVCMLKCPCARYWTPNCSWCADLHLAQQPQPSVYACMNYCKLLWTKASAKCNVGGAHSTMIDVQIPAAQQSIVSIVGKLHHAKICTHKLLEICCGHQIQYAFILNLNILSLCCI